MRRMRLLPLIAATYFMVSGGPYGLEDIIGKAGYGQALLLLLAVPLLWSLPTSLMVGELASALPEEGGYYCWVRRALGNFWGFQEAWLSLAASVFDMAIYPVIFVLYLGRIEPLWTAGYRGTLWALAVVLLCTLWNLRGAVVVGEGSMGMFVLLLAPFVVLIGASLWKALISAHGAVAIAPMGAPPTGYDLAGAISVTLWNYMGWDNASTVAQEVDQPQRNYPRAMLIAAGLVAITYILPAARSRVRWNPRRSVLHRSMDRRRTHHRRPIARPCRRSRRPLNGAGMFNALMLSYTRVPYALAKDGLLPQLLTRTNRAGVPWVSVLLCSIAWALALNLSFERLISIDLVLYGAALILEFVALVVLRLREPSLPRPFKVPGGIAGAVASGIGPTLLIAFALWAARSERVGPFPALGFAAAVAVAGPLALPPRPRRKTHRSIKKSRSNQRPSLYIS